MCSGYVEGMVTGLKSKSEAHELENTWLREAICLPDLQVLFDLCVCVCAHAHAHKCMCVIVCLCAHKMVNACIYVHIPYVCMYLCVYLFIDL